MSAGVPHLDASVFVPQIFWLIVFFSAFFLCMNAVFVPALRRILSQRADVLQEDILVTKKMKDDLCRQQILCTEKIDFARRQAASLVAAAADTARENNLLAHQRLSKEYLLEFQRVEADIATSAVALKNDATLLSQEVYALIVKKIGLS